MKPRITSLKSGIVAVIFFTAPTFAGARIDLRPTPPVPPGGYQPGTDVQVDAFLVDTGNPQGNISFRGIFLDFSDSPPWGGERGTFTYPDPDGIGPLGEGHFWWVLNITIGQPLPPLPLTSWVYPLTQPIPPFMITMPDNGEVLLGHLVVDVGTSGGILNSMNADNPDPNFGAAAAFGFGGPGDPVTLWRAFTGELTGGVLELPVVPEPGSCLLLAIGVAAMIFRRKGCS